VLLQEDFGSEEDKILTFIHQLFTGLDLNQKTSSARAPRRTEPPSQSQNSHGSRILIVLEGRIVTGGSPV